MRSTTTKQLLTLACAALIGGYFNCANADTVQSVSTPNSNAMAFSVEAGSIAGAAQACGQDVSVFVSRVGEAINKLSMNPQDRVFAMASFQKALDRAQQTQKSSYPIPCNQVMQDYNSLPIMRPDYQQTVISQLNPGMNVTGGATNQNPSANAPASNNMNSQNSPYTQTMQQAQPNNPPPTASFNPPPPPTPPTPATPPNAVGTLTPPPPPTPPTPAANPFSQGYPATPQQQYVPANNTQNPPPPPQPYNNAPTNTGTGNY